MLRFGWAEQIQQTLNKAIANNLLLLRLTHIEEDISMYIVT